MAGLVQLLPKYEVPESVCTREVMVLGRDGAPEVKARVYLPDTDGPRPGYLHIHGGGFVMSDIDTFEQQAAEVAIECGAVVITPEYRLAPEDPFPAGAEDCYEGLIYAQRLLAAGVTTEVHKTIQGRFTAARSARTRP